MPVHWFAAVLVPFLTLPAQETATAYVLETSLLPAEVFQPDPIWYRPGCLQLHCGDEEWRRELRLLPVASRPSPRLPGVRSARPLSAPARPRDSRSSYSSDARIGTRYGMQLVRDGDARLGIEVGAGYRLTPAYDDGVSVPGPIFRGGINLGYRFGERAQWSQRVQFEAGGGQHFVKQMFGLDVSLADDWQLETDYVIRYDSLGASGSDTAEAWLGVRRLF